VICNGAILENKLFDEVSKLKREIKESKIPNKGRQQILTDIRVLFATLSQHHKHMDSEMGSLLAANSQEGFSPTLDR